MFVLVEIAFRNLVQARRRTLLLTTGLAIVTFMLVSLQALSRSVADQVLRASTTLSSGHVNVAGFNKGNPSEASPYIRGLAEIRKVVAENTPDVDYVIDRYRGWTQLASETDSLQTGVAGVDIAEEPRLVELLQLAAESEYHDGGSDEALGDVRGLAREDSIVVFASHAKQLGVTVGDQLTMISQTPDGQANTSDLHVVAVARDISMLSNWTVFVPKIALRRLYTMPEDTSGAVHIFLKHPERAQETMARVRNVLVEKGYPLMDYNANPFWTKFETVSGEDWIGQKLDVTYWKDEVSFVVWILTIVDAVSVFLVSILLIIIAVGITNTMWISVRERTAEIGTLRAIGMSNGKVLAMFLLEAVLLGLFATCLGAALAEGGALLIDAIGIDLPRGALRAFLMSDRLSLTVTAINVAGSVTAITLVTILASLWPAIRASRLQPITAIHHVD